MKRNLTYITFSLFIAIGLITGCKPYEQEGIELPGAPSASFSWNFIDAVDSLGQVIGVDSNRVALIADPVDGAFLHLWDFGNGQTSDQTADTAYYPQEGDYTITYSVHTAGGMGTASATVNIAQTLELPCEGNLALLTGCENQKTWKFSDEIGAISVGPDPYSTEWYSSPPGGLESFQFDDRYQFTEDGIYVYNNNGSTMNPFEGYVETEVAIDPTTYFMSEGTGTSGEDQINLSAFSETLCGFMGVWDSGPVYDILELTEDRLVIHGPIQTGDCQQSAGWFTLIFVVD
ncbi:MAG: PKD domain-containing protein [Bacteroidetes bacterium]|nr:PKD domain-containing protein [Bacteroidota bacterium]MDA1336314.1 PKD domain-containing protein [Bacteroidota bacterium]